jgi:protein subunit release factor B
MELKRNSKIELEHQQTSISADIEKTDKAKKNTDRQLLSLKEELHHQDDDNQTLTKLKSELDALSVELDTQNKNRAALEKAKKQAESEQAELTRKIEEAGKNNVELGV